MKIIFAQGNPDTQYARTRHNVGFVILDALSDGWKKHSKANADVSELTLNGEKVILVKPLSYYNETGNVARALIDFYKLTPSEDFLVVHDDLALPFGSIRVRDKGSDGGNNGIKSLNQHLGDDYRRLRIGIWNDLRDKIDDADFVLSAFTANEKKQLDDTIVPHAVRFIEDFVNNKLENTSTFAL